MKIFTGYNLCLLTGSLKKVKRESAMNDKKIFNICKYDDYDCKMSWRIKMQNIGKKYVYHLDKNKKYGTLFFKEYFEQNHHVRRK